MKYSTKTNICMIFRFLAYCMAFSSMIVFLFSWTIVGSINGRILWSIDSRVLWFQEPIDFVVASEWALSALALIILPIDMFVGIKNRLMSKKLATVRIVANTTFLMIWGYILYNWMYWRIVLGHVDCKIEMPGLYVSVILLALSIFSIIYFIYTLIKIVTYDPRREGAK